MKNYNSQIRFFIFIHFLFLFIFANTKSLFAQKQWKAKDAAVTFKIKNAGFTVDGKFGMVTANVAFDTENFAKGTIEASLEAKTINTDNETRDNHLRKPEYFDVTKFPQISIKSKKIAKLAGNNYEGVFDLMLKGVSKEVKIPFSYTESGASASFKGEFTINRLDFGVGKSSWILSDNATIKIVLNVNQ
jgi:polyisoprenoid-binding protein YceI